MFFSCDKDTTIVIEDEIIPQDSSIIEEPVITEQPLLIGDTVNNSNLIIKRLDNFEFSNNLKLDLPIDTPYLATDILVKFEIYSSAGGRTSQKANIEIKNPGVQFIIGDKSDTICIYKYTEIINEDTIRYYIENECMPVENQEVDSVAYRNNTYVRGFDAGETIIDENIMEWSEEIEYPVYQFQSTNTEWYPNESTVVVENKNYVLGFWERNVKKYIAFRYKKEGVTKYGWLSMLTNNSYVIDIELVYQE